jgi:hypothetical protein
MHGQQVRPTTMVLHANRTKLLPCILVMSMPLVAAVAADTGGSVTGTAEQPAPGDQLPEHGRQYHQQQQPGVRRGSELLLYRQRGAVSDRACDVGNSCAARRAAARRCGAACAASAAA